MRVTSDIWVSALVRRVFSAGGFASIERRGASEAGAIFVRWRSREGLTDLYGPAPQAVFDERKPADRRFECLARGLAAEAADSKLAREAAFDSDLWIVEIEGVAPEDYLALAG